MLSRSHVRSAGTTSRMRICSISSPEMSMMSCHGYMRRSLLLCRLIWVLAWQPCRTSRRNIRYIGKHWECHSYLGVLEWLIIAKLEIALSCQSNYVKFLPKFQLWGCTLSLWTWLPRWWSTVNNNKLTLFKGDVEVSILVCMWPRRRVSRLQVTSGGGMCNVTVLFVGSGGRDRVPRAVDRSCRQHGPSHGGD